MKITGVKNFNSHAHVERDYSERTIYKIHGDFNSHAHVERDAFKLFYLADLQKFQLTRSRGA